MNFLFPDRVPLTRDPLGFLLSRADLALAPLAPLALGFHRVHLISDLALIKDGPFGCGTLGVSNFPSAVFAPITICERREEQLTAQDTVAKKSITCKRVINNLIHTLLIDLRKSIFLAYQHASFDCWYFSSLLATKLTFTTLFGSDSRFLVDQRAFANHAELIYSERDLLP